MAVQKGITKQEDVRLYDSIVCTSPPITFDEIKKIISMMVEEFDYTTLCAVFEDVVRLFNGEFPGYQKSNTRYHDLEHTVCVTLAFTRLLHGVHITGRTFSSANILSGVVSALFHDTGLIQTEDDKDGSGAKYTIGHEKRSIRFIKNYLPGKGFTQEAIEDCTHLISCTVLNMSPAEIPFRSEQTEMMGKILGSADLLAQMADRNYLEKLLLLFQEFEEAGLPGFDSELDLLKKTEEFYESTAKTKLLQEFGGVGKYFRYHYKERWGIDRDLYAESITKNLEYLKSIKTACEDSNLDYLQNLRRRGIVKKLLEEE